MLLRSCNRCGNLIPYGSPYCKTCAPIIETEREERRRESKRISDREYNKKRDPKYLKFYRSIEWRTLSRKRLQDDGYRCVKCGAIAAEVDHIKPIQTPEGWELRLEESNLQSLCIPCHNEKHERFKRRRGYLNAFKGSNNLRGGVKGKDID